MGNQIFEKLMLLAKRNGIDVRFLPFKAYKGLLRADSNNATIGIKSDMGFNEKTYTLAHELAHYYLHSGNGDIIGGDRHAEYEEQADRAAKMLLAALAVGQKGGA
ncbi:ImmA/IrrE family metallo-endopeptidase [Lachnospiraceae bacterium 29-84]